MWWWIILFLPGIGPLVYFFVRWLPTHNVPAPRWVVGLRRGTEIRRLESSARQIGNAYHFVHLADALRETGQFDRAADACAARHRKGANQPGAALWGGDAQVDMHFKGLRHRQKRAAGTGAQDRSAIQVRRRLADVREIAAPSLNRTGSRRPPICRSTSAAGGTPRACTSWHGLDSESQEARDNLQAMLMEIESEPAPHRPQARLVAPPRAGAPAKDRLERRGAGDAKRLSGSRRTARLSVVAAGTSG